MFESMILATSSGALLKFGSYPILFKSVKKSSVEEEFGLQNAIFRRFHGVWSSRKREIAAWKRTHNADRNKSGVAGV